VDEGQDRVDTDGELQLPADESLADLDAIELDAEEEPDVETVGAGDDLDVDIED
jgi:hypothetical protein